MLRDARGHGIYAGWRYGPLFGYERTGRPFDTRAEAEHAARELAKQTSLKFDVVWVTGNGATWTCVPADQAPT